MLRSGHLPEPSMERRALPTLLPQNSKAQVALHEEGIVIVSLEVKSPLFCLTF
jgi:hypothetical protein